MKNWIQKLELHILSVEIIVFENPLLHKIIHYFFNLSHIRRKKCNDELLDLVEDVGIAESMFSDYTKRGYRGIYIFADSPHFLLEEAEEIVMESSLEASYPQIMEMLQREREIIFFGEIFLAGEDKEEALASLWPIKDSVLLHDSCIILLLHRGLEKLNKFLERELVGVV